MLQYLLKHLSLRRESHTIDLMPSLRFMGEQLDLQQNIIMLISTALDMGTPDADVRGIMIDPFGSATC